MQQNPKPKRIQLKKALKKPPGPGPDAPTRGTCRYWNRCFNPLRYPVRPCLSYKLRIWGYIQWTQRWRHFLDR